MTPINGNNESGFILPTIIGFILAIGIISVALVEIINTNINIVGNNIKSQEALNIAEAGINYYLWHLSHNNEDFRDGQSTPVNPHPDLGYGPYTHNYVDDDAVNRGTYTLWIKPQGSGSTVVNVRAIGKTHGSNITRTIDAKLGAPSYASYAVSSDSALWFGSTETATGPVHSNSGVRMDGPNTSDVTSSNSSYVPSYTLGGDGNSHPGVWCHPSITNPNCNTRSKVDWRYPVPTIDFNKITSNLCSMKKVAFASDPSTASLANLPNACSQTPTTRTTSYLPQRSTSGSYSISRGYLITLNSNNTYDVSYVNAENDRSTPYTSALSLQNVATNIAVPASGVIFVEDNVWIRSSPSGFHGRVTIAAGRLATTANANIVIADDLTVVNKNSSDAIGLVAENDVLIAPYAPPETGSFNFEIDAAIIAQNGSVLYPGTYRTDANRCTRGWVSPNQTFTFFGSVATRETWTWTWLQGSSPCGDAVRDVSTNRYISGVHHNNSQYNYNFLYNPPPHFPITSTYNVLYWREVLTKP